MDSLFNKQYYRSHLITEKGEQLPLSVAVTLLIREESDEEVVLSDVAMHDIGYCESRGLISGAIRITECETGRVFDGFQSNSIWIPSWVEADDLSMELDGVTGIILVESEPVFDALCDQGVFQKNGMLLATGLGLPRASFRRFLRRLSEEKELPVFTLTDCDTWGYFLFSVLKRGAVFPTYSCSRLSIDKLRHLGLFARDATIGGRAWEPIWSMRVSAMRSYECFLSARWQHEFDCFEANRTALDLQSFLKRDGIDRLAEMISVRILSHEWIE